MPMASITARHATRLGEFNFAGRFVPLAAFVVLAAGMYLLYRNDSTFQLLGSALLGLLLELWRGLPRGVRAAGSTGPISGPGSTVATCAGGSGVRRRAGWLRCCSHCIRVDWITVWSTSPRTVLREWLLGSIFSAFFVGLSLASAAARQRERADFESRHHQLEERLHMLAARIEPHFLMNTLATCATW